MIFQQTLEPYPYQQCNWGTKPGRRRTCVVGSFLDSNSAFMLVCAQPRHVTGTQWGNNKYINMKRLEASL